MSLVEDATQQQLAAFAAFRDLPEGAWVMERLIGDNYVMDEIPTRLPTGDGTLGDPLTQFEQGLCEGRRVLANEILGLFQASMNDAYEAVKRVDLMAKIEADKEPFAES